MSPRVAIPAMLGCVAIYGSDFAITRGAMVAGPTPQELAALRFGTAGPLLLPSLMRRGVRDCAGVGWWRGIALCVTSGIPMTLPMNTGFSLAPASHGASITPGTVTVVGIVFGVLLNEVRPSPQALAGIGFVLERLAGMGLAGSRHGAARRPAVPVLRPDLTVLSGRRTRPSTGA